MFLTNEQANARLNSEKNLARASFLKQGDTTFRRPENTIDPEEPSEILAKASEILAKDPEKFLNPESLPKSLPVTEKVIPLSGKNRINLTQEERTNIAIATRTGTKTQTEVARASNLTVVAVNNIHNGKTKGIDEARVREVTNNVRDLALERLMSSLGLLSDDKLSGCSAKDLSVIASNMGRVVEKIQDKVQAPDSINFIIYSPELKQERAFDTIEI